MFKNIFHRVLLRRHFWRHATLGEVAELYVSRMLRLSAVNIVGAFMSIYLFQIGYSVSQIGFFWAAFYIFKACISLLCARIIAKIGPKHATLMANISYIPAVVAFALLPQYGDWLLPVIIVFQGFSITLYTIAYNVDFSKVKNAEHAGKEIAYMHILEKLTTGLSPVIGGLVAFFAGPQATLILSSILFAFAAAPLLRTPEPVKTRQKLSYKGFPWRLYFKQAPAQLALGFDVASAGNIWSMYTAILIIGVSAANDVYLISGILTSVIFFAALIASYVYGKIIDRKHGRELMMAGAVANSLTHFIRPFTNNTVSVAGVNAVHEMAATGYTLPYLRGMYDNADLSGKRREYLGLIEITGNVGAALASATLGFFAMYAGHEFALKYFFFIAGAVGLLMLTVRYPLYKR